MLDFYESILDNVNEFIYEIRKENDKTMKAIIAIKGKQYVNECLFKNEITLEQHTELRNLITNR